ncbi:MAG: Rrf2 family transcriptional regulator [Candidatus Altimarinota bacterium]
MIKLSKKGDYGLKAISYIAQSQEKILKISDISKNLDISEAFLRRIINNFEKAHLVKTLKGRNGGVYIDKKLGEISLYDILSSLGEDLFITSCTSGEFCENEKTCVTTNILKSLQKGFSALLKLYTLEKIIKK